MLGAERSEQAVWNVLYRNADSKSGKLLGISCQQYLDAHCLRMTCFPAWFFNRVVGLGLEGPVSEDDIDSLIEHYHSKRVPIGISLCPNEQSKKITQWLKDRNFSIANHWVKMVRDPSPPVQSTSKLRIEPATNDQAGIVADIIQTGFGLNDELQPFSESVVSAENNFVYIAWEEDIPAAVGALTIVGSIGHLNTAATLPEFRGKGAQGAIMARRIEDGIKLGCQSFVTETWDPGEETNHSFNNMARYGFELAYKRPNWVLEFQ